MLVLDRFEGDWAVIEDNGTVFNLPKKLLPPGAAEGDVIEISVEVAAGETEKRRGRIQRLANDLFENDSQDKA
jgi:hypothetical protein